MPEFIAVLPGLRRAGFGSLALNGTVDKIEGSAMPDGKDQVLTGARPALPLLGLLAIAVALGIAAAICLAGIALVLAAPAYGAVPAEDQKVMCSPSESVSQPLEPIERAEEAADEEPEVRYAVLIVLQREQPRIRQWQM